MPKDYEALFDLAFDLYESQEKRQAFEVAFRERVTTDPTARDLFLAYACDRLIPRIAQECSRRAKVTHLEPATAPRMSSTTPAGTVVAHRERTARDVLVEAIRYCEQYRQQQEAMAHMVDESVQRHQQRPEDFAEGEQVLLAATPGAEEILGRVVGIAGEQVIVHFELIDGSVVELGLSPKSLQKQRPTSDQQSAPDDRANTDA